jgi:hypothetical protein
MWSKLRALCVKHNVFSSIFAPLRLCVKQVQSSEFRVQGSVESRICHPELAEGPNPELTNIKSRIFPKSIFLFILFSLFFSLKTTAQQVSATIDTAQIKIGEQITYQLSVVADSSKVVTFPEGQTFAPLEMVEALKTDTTSSDGRWELLKKYRLTQWDSGSYSIPPQKVFIGNQTFKTDSFLIEVGGIAVDTTKQKMYPIKPALEVPERFVFPKWIWWVLGGLIVLGLLIWLILKLLKKKQAAEKELPPFEKAMHSLEELDKEHLLEEREVKTYYSKLTEAARRYLDEQVDERAMESTTEELISHLKVLKDSGRLNISQQTIDDFDKILKRADLAKFARSKPDVITAKEDRSSIEKIIVDTKAGIPEPDEEELQKNLEYQANLERKRRQRKRLAWAGGIAGAVVLAVAVLVYTKGFTYISDTVFGNQTKELLESEWLTSTYGNPPTTLTTPRVLVRDTTVVAEDGVKSVESFSVGKIHGDFYTEVTTTILKKQQQNFDSQQAVDDLVSILEEKGAKNIITDVGTHTTPSEIEGQKITGSFSIEDESGESLKKTFTALVFPSNVGMQQILMVYDKNDSHADEIANRIVYSVELKNESR